jgi:hypothetical protein
MRIITLYQPYATLMVMKFKKNETRSWRFGNVLGPLGIAAAAKTPTWCKALLTQWPFCEDLNGISLPTGAILGTVEIKGYQSSQSWVDEMSNPNMTEEAIRAAEREYRYGDYSPNRWIWKTDNAVQFEKPVLAKGSQGFWKFELPNEVIQQGQLPIFS